MLVKSTNESQMCNMQFMWSLTCAKVYANKKGYFDDMSIGTMPRWTQAWKANGSRRGQLTDANTGAKVSDF